LCTDIEKNPGPSGYVDATKTIHAAYCQRNVTVFGENAGQQCVALPMSLCALIYSKITKITSVDDMTQIMMVGIQLYSSLSLLARQSVSMLTELLGMGTVFEQFFHLEYSDSYTCNIHDPRIEGYHYCICHSQGTAFETLLALNYNSFIITVAIIGVGIYSIEAGEYKVFDSHARDIYHNSHSEGTCVLLEIPSMHKLVQYFQTVHRNEDILIYI
ncbi:unnamed protein product, partial [Porites evermanni]